MNELGAESAAQQLNRPIQNTMQWDEHFSFRFTNTMASNVQDDGKYCTKLIDADDEEEEEKKNKKKSSNIVDRTPNS